MRGVITNKYFHLAAVAIVFVATILYGVFYRSQEILTRTQAAEWYSYDWGYRTAITFDNTKIDSDLTDFPVLISSTNSEWATIANGGHVAQSDGSDFLFTSSDNTTQLSHEIEKYDPATGQLIAWVKIPTLSGSADTIINLYYGNATIGNQENITGVWSNSYAAVFHLNQASGTIIDSTSNARNSTAQTLSAYGATCKIGFCPTFNGTSDYIELPSFTPGMPVTIETWMYRTAGTGGIYDTAPWTANGSRQVNDNVDWHPDGNLQNISPTDNQWISYAFELSFDTNRIVQTFKNGVSLGSVTGNTTNTLAWNTFRIGDVNRGETRYNGNLDEFRISTVLRSADWLEAQYNNQSSPDTFYALNNQSADTLDPTNPVISGAYDSSGKANSLVTDHWYNYNSPYFEYSGATDDLSGVTGYYRYFGTDSAADPVSEGTYLAHSGGLGDIQSYTSGIEPVSGTTYYFRVSTKDAQGNIASGTTLFTYKFESVSPPAPEYINTSPVGCSTNTTFTFSWPEVVDTGGSSLGTYQYKRGTSGTVTDYAETTLTTTSYQEGDNILYVRAKDNAGNLSSWQTSVFCSTATVQVIDGPTVIAGPSSITASWVSSKATTGYVKVYEGNTYISEQGLTSYSLSHTVKVIGLEPEKSYRYQITWTDQSGNLGETDWYSTSTVAAPQINNLQVDVLSPTSVNISWSSTVPARFNLEYGIGNYGTVAHSNDLLTGYSTRITGLLSGSIYQFRVNATGEDGTKFFAGESVVTPSMPTIGNFKFEPLKDRPDTAVKIAWTTNVALTSTVYYGPKDSPKKEVSKSDSVVDHEIVIGELEDNTEYELSVSGIDQYGNIAQSGLQILRTEFDTRPPRINEITIETSNVGSNQNDEAQATIGYKTDEPARCFIDYGEGISGENYSDKTKPDEALANNHLSIISELEPQTPYHFRITCQDQSTNETVSNDQTVISGEITQSVFNIVIKTLNNLFGWLGSVL